MCGALKLMDPKRYANLHPGNLAFAEENDMLVRLIKSVSPHWHGGMETWLDFHSCIRMWLLDGQKEKARTDSLQVGA